jgi:hypothetical protein
LIHGCIGEREGDLELGDSFAEHSEVDVAARCHRGEQIGERISVRLDPVERGKNGLPYGLISEAGTVGCGHRQNQSVIKLVELGADGASRPLHPATSTGSVGEG